MLNIVEMVADQEDCAFDQPCKFGHRVEGHAVYCQNDAWKAGPRKCRRTWYSGGEYRDTDCVGFAPNPLPHKDETVDRETALATLYDDAVEEDAFVMNLARHKRAEWNRFNRGEGSFTYPHKAKDYIVPPPPPSAEEIAYAHAFSEMLRTMPVSTIHGLSASAMANWGGRKTNGKPKRRQRTKRLL